MRTVTLGEVAQVDRKTVDPATLPAETYYLGLEHIERGGRIVGRDSVGGAEVTSSKFLFTSRHVLFGKLRPNLAKVSRPDFDGVCSTDILPVRPGPDLDRSYLAHFLTQPTMIALASRRATGANLPRLSPSSLAEFVIPLPSIAEQRRVAAILDHADALRAKRCQVLDQLDSLEEGIAQSFFASRDDPRRELSELADKVVVGHVGPTSEFFRDRGVPFLRTGNIGKGQVQRSDLARVAPEFHERLRKSQLRAGDVLVSRVVTDEIRAALLPDDLDGANCANIIIVRPSERVYETTILAFLGLPSTQRRLLGRRVGSAQSVVNTTVLKRLLIPEVPVEAQRLLARKMNQLMVQRRQRHHQVRQSNELFGSLQSRAFSGEL